MMRQKKINDAIENLNEALKKDPNNPLALYHLALTYVQNKEKNQALKFAKKVMDIEYYTPMKGQAQKLLKNISSL